MSGSAKRPIDEYPEHQILPGVTITDFRNSTDLNADLQHSREESAHSGGGDGGGEESGVLLLLQAAIERIETALFHLRRSNQEMHEYDPEGKDPELVDAIAENVIVMQRYESKVEELRRELGIHAPCAAASQPAESNSSRDGLDV
eukprot:ANDGO_07061.mRNA.1 hypothetical protein